MDVGGLSGILKHDKINHIPTVVSRYYIPTKIMLSVPIIYK